MSRETISFRLESEKREALDAVAAALDRDRSYVINEAIEAYLDVHRWQTDHIRQGLRQARGERERRVFGALADFSRWMGMPSILQDGTTPAGQVARLLVFWPVLQWLHRMSQMGHKQTTDRRTYRSDR